MPLTPIFVEKATGDQAAPEVEAQHGGLTKDRRLTEYVDFVGRRMLPFSKRNDYPHKFQVLESSDIVNAFALGNGNIYVTKGLLGLLEDEAELAEVVGHEMGHVSNRHIASQIDKIIGVTGILALAEGIYAYQKDGKVSEGSQQLIDTANAVVPALIINGFSRENEFEADDSGLSYMSKAGYSPLGAVRVFERFKKMEPEEKGIEIFFRSHPFAKDRIDALNVAIKGGKLGGGQDYRSRYQNIIHHGETLADQDRKGVMGVPTPVVIAAAAVLAVGATVVLFSV